MPAGRALPVAFKGGIGLARYIVKRVLAALITIWFIMTITFVLMNAIPGSPLDSEKFLDVTLKQAMLAKYGLDRPLYERYLKYLADYLHGDFGISYIKVGLSTNEIIAAGFPYSLRIGIYSSVLIIIFGVLLVPIDEDKNYEAVLYILRYFAHPKVVKRNGERRAARRRQRPKERRRKNQERT